MVCTKCGSIIPDGYTSCAYCGTPVNVSVSQTPVQPVSQPVQSEPFVRKNGMATTGLVFGIITVVVSFILLVSGLDNTAKETFSTLMVHPAILGIIFSSVGIAKSRIFGGKGKAITGLILSICGVIISFAGMVMFT